MKKLIKIILAVSCFMVLLSGCTKPEESVKPDPEPTPEPAPAPDPEPDPSYVEYFNALQEENKSSLRLYDSGEFELIERNGTNEFTVKGLYGREGNTYMFSNFDSFNTMYGDIVYNFEFFIEDDGSLFLNEDLFTSHFGTPFTKDGQLPEWYSHGGMIYGQRFVREDDGYTTEEYFPYIDLYEDSTFMFIENCFAMMNDLQGTYEDNGKQIICKVERNNLMGFKGEDVTEIIFDKSDDKTLILQTEICMSQIGDKFLLKD